MSGALDLVRGQALIDIEKQPALLVHLVGVGKPDGQVADKRAQHRVGLAELAPHGGGINDVDHRVGGRDRPRGAFTLAKDRGHLAEQLAGLQRRQHQPLARDDFHRAGVDQLEIVTFLAKIENHLASLEQLADHIHDKLHNHTPLFKPAS